MRKRRIKLIILIFLLPLLFLLAFLVAERLRGWLSLARYKRALLAQGVKLTPQAFVSPPPPGENGAPEVSQAYHELQPGAVLPKDYPPAMQLTPSGRAIVGFREEQWVQEHATNRWDDVATDLETNGVTLARIRAALAAPVLDNQLDFSQGPHMSFKHLLPAKALTRWFGARSQLALHDGRPHEALEDLLPCLRLPQLLARDHLAISELVRIAVAAIARAQTWEALQADGWTDADLARLQQAWQGDEFAAAMAQALEGEAVFSETCYGQMRKSNAEAAAVLFGWDDFMSPTGWERLVRKLPAGETLAGFCKRQIYCRVWRFAWLDEDEQHDLEENQRLLGIARTALTTKSWTAIQPAIARFDQEASARGFYDRLRYHDESFFHMSSVMNKAMHAETERSLTLAAIALKRYSLAYRHPPPSLDSLVPKFLAAVPVDYMDGHPLRYHPNPDGTFTLYSVGDDGKDDGGDAAVPAEKARSQNFWARKDVVWPVPVLPSEVEAYRREAALK